MPIDEQETEVEVLRQEQTKLRDVNAANELPEVEKLLQSLKEQLAKLREDHKHLQLVARSNGTVLPPPETPDKPLPESQLHQWSGSPLDQKNVGAYMASVLF